jgi:hypothetical protein
MLAGDLVSLDVNDHEIVLLGDDQGPAGSGRLKHRHRLRQAIGAPRTTVKTRRSPKSATTKASAWTSLERVDRCCTPSLLNGAGPPPAAES